MAKASMADSVSIQGPLFGFSLKPGSKTHIKRELTL
jgi:hypothetical protein